MHLSLIKAEKNLIVVKNENKTTLDVACEPFFPLNEKYYTITIDERGKNYFSYIFTCTEKDGTTYDFQWGAGGYTCISESMSKKKSLVLQFIRDTCGIELK